jgi:hypothetical protein
MLQKVSQFQAELADRKAIKDCMHLHVRADV